MFLLGVLFAVDCGLLLAMLRGRTWLIEWMGCTRDGFERFFIAAYLASAYSSLLGRGWPLFFLLLPAFVAVCMWRRHRAPDAVRGRRLLAPEEIAGRVAMVMAMGVLLVVDCLPPASWASAGMNLSFLCFQYSAALPDQGESGRRAKLSLAKLRELFPRWEPVPEGA